MPLVKSPTLSLAKLAANRANARKSTGPRSPRGKARVALNSLRSGRRAPTFWKRLRQTGSEDDLCLFYAILERLYECFRPQTPRDENRAEKLACEVWCALKGKIRPAGVKARELDAGQLRRSDRPLDPFPGRARYQIEDRRRGLRLTFWTQRVGPPALRPVDPMKIFWRPVPRQLRPFAVVFKRFQPSAAGESDGPVEREPER
jgi:hypothetical protein